METLGYAVRSKPPAAAEAAQHLATLRAVAESPLVRPSLRVAARRALKALAPSPRRCTERTNARRLWVHEEE